MRQEHADQAELEQDQEGVKLLDPLIDVVPGDQHANGRQQCGEQHQPQAEAVEPT